MDTARPLRARGATGADDAKLSSSESEPTKPSDSSSSELHAAFFAFGFGFGLAAALGAAFAFAGAAFGAGAGFATGFGFGGAFLAGAFFCLAPQSSSESSSKSDSSLSYVFFFLGARLETACVGSRVAARRRTGSRDNEDAATRFLPFLISVSFRLFRSIFLRGFAFGVIDVELLL